MKYLSYSFPFWISAQVLACPFHEPDAPKWNPLGRETYITSSFGENRGTRFHAGVDWSTGKEEGWPVQAPEDGFILELRDSPFGYGKALLFQGVSGHRWLFAHLSGFHPSLDSAFNAEKRKRRVNQLTWSPPRNWGTNQFKEYGLLAYSGSTGIGEPHLHMELRDSSENLIFNPCAFGIACPDTLPPRVLAAAVWDAARPAASLRLSSEAALQKGCLEVDPDYQEPRLAFKIVDYSRYPLENPMSVYEITLRIDDRRVFHKEYQRLQYGQMDIIREELLWAEESDTAGDWHSMAPGTIKNPSVSGSGRDLSAFLRNAVRLSDKKASLKPLKVDILDFRYQLTTLNLIPRAKCAPENTAPWYKTQDSLLFTFLSRPWIHLGICNRENVKISLLDSSKQILYNRICSDWPHQPVQLSAILDRWPGTRTITISDPQSPSRAIAVHPLALRPDQEIRWEQDGVLLHLRLQRPLFPTALAWEIRDTLALRPQVLVTHPKGLFLKGKARFCLRDPQQHPANRLYWLGETSREWYYFSKQDSLVSGNSFYRCAESDELRDLVLHADTIAPDLGAPRDTLAMVLGKPAPVWRIPVVENGSGIPHGNAIQAFQGKNWIPVEYDSGPRELVIHRADLKPDVSLEIRLEDEAGNQRARIIRLR